ncbi:protein-L-isoaspartate O-methyltransferase family protein [Fangia hongkongensis]|uniref:protein-L-isoaspartate O-methyltransferase family protein n=1 Tax=Fangia hongkongensis TaxID=270495 RepID=UPI00035E4D56|nr:rRNA adenine N-6-methyltransferase family protein [Fangia hongkongensis]MBK2124701.1 hypothetical protein [Fangia hongkongensis]
MSETLTEAVDLEYAKENMIKQQVRILGVPYGKMLDAMIQIPRELFVPKDMKALAYSELDIPVNHGRYAFTPKTVTQILQAVALKHSDTVLQVGIGCGYLTALMAKLASMIELYDIHEDMINHVKHRLKSLAIYNIKYQHAKEIESKAHYDVIVLRETQLSSPDAYIDQLSPNGRLLYFVDKVDYITAVLVTKKQGATLEKKCIFDLYTKVNKVAQTPEAFAF